MKAKSIISILVAGFAFLGIQAHAAVNFHVSDDALASAEWDNWTNASSTADSTPLSQGSGTTTTAGGGFTFTSTEVTTEILHGYNSFIGGLLPPSGPTAGDSYYIHDGAYEWNVDVTLSSAVDYFRVSYALAGSTQFGAASDFSNTPSLSDAEAIASGSYNYDGNLNSVFYTTFELDEASENFTISFGDVVFGGPSFPGSFKSVDGIYVEAFNGSPNAVPEPQSFALISGLVTVLLLAARRRVRN